MRICRVTGPAHARRIELEASVRYYHSVGTGIEVGEVLVLDGREQVVTSFIRSDRFRLRRELGKDFVTKEIRGKKILERRYSQEIDDEGYYFKLIESMENET